ncbi:MAG: peroxide stress protein YaaA [Lachnospiraceae bacterium]|nr:peroxide stress protein YaaA [Lachnospiraceae bacterium]
MIAIISPAKNMKIQEDGTPPMSVPIFLQEAGEIWGELRKCFPLDLQELMKISETLSEDSFDRIQAMKWDEAGTCAIETYDGIQYKYMDPLHFSAEAKAFAKNHVRILSGMYGVLQPYDSIYEYRLEMGTRLSVNESKNLYDFWKDKLYRELEEELRDSRIHKTGEPVILNLASEEYGKIIKKYRKDPVRIVTCHFKTYSKGKYRVLATAAKMARGSMIRYLSMNQMDDLEGVKSFDWNGYCYEEALSTPEEYVFLKK